MNPLQKAGACPKLTVNEKIEGFLKRAGRAGHGDMTVLMGIAKIIADHLDALEAELIAERLERQRLEACLEMPPSNRVN